MIESLYPNWPAPNNINAFTTTRKGGVSLPPFDSLNLATHVDDIIEHVLENRQRLQIANNIPNEPYWLNQTHGINAIDISDLPLLSTTNHHLKKSIVGLDGDATYTNQPNKVCVVLTADCLPVLFYSKMANEVAAAHAGWRGLCDGILEQTVAHFNCATSEIVVWIGPAISTSEFIVGEEVKNQFEAVDPNTKVAFNLINANSKKYTGDLNLIAKQRLNKLGIKFIYGGDYCTVKNAEKFYSFRRDSVTGRFASMIWFD